MSLFIGRLNTSAKVSDLENLFEKCGKIARCHIKKGVQFNFGFVEYETKADAAKAIQELQGREILGDTLKIEWSRGERLREDRKREARTTACFKCGREGHWARDCRDTNDRRDHRDRYTRRRSFSRSPPRRRSPRRSPPVQRTRSPPSAQKRSPPRRRSISPNTMHHERYASSNFDAPSIADAGW